MTTRPAFAPWDERTAPRIVSPTESARRVQIFAAVEARVARLLDAFAPSIPEIHGQAILARHARHHEFHAEVLRDRVADAAGSAGTVVDAELAGFLDALGEPAGGAQTIEFLTGIYRVLLPRAITAYTYFLRALGADANDADQRWYEMILRDSLDAVRDGELLLQSLLLGPDEVERSADRRMRLESVMTRTGGLVGPDSLGLGAAR